jgi:glycosidase
MSRSEISRRVVCFFGAIVAAGMLALSPAGCTNPEEIEDRGSIKKIQVEDWRDEVIYQILVDRFEDGDINNNYNVDKSSPGRYHGGDWQGIIDRLDYLQELGVTALWISPVVKNIEEDAGFASYHGYWTQDFTEVNPHFGDLTKLRQLVDECHRRDIKVILDIVTNHIGQLFYYDINGNGSPDEFFIGGGGVAYGSNNDDFSSDLTRTSEWDPDYDSRGIQGFTSLGEFGPAPIKWVYAPGVNRVPPQPPEFQNPEWYNRRGRVTVWRYEQEACRWVTGDPNVGHWWDVPECRDYVREQETKGDFPGGLKDLKTERQDVRDALYRAFAYWIEAADFDGFRIDTLKHVEHGFWKDFCPRIRTKAAQLGKRNFFMFGEAFDGHDDLLASYVGDEQVDSVFYFSQKYTVFDGVIMNGAPTRNIETLFRDRLGDPSDPAFTPIYTDTPNSGGPVDSEGVPISPRKLMVNFIDNHDVARFRFLFDDTQVHHNALFFLLTEDGIPCIYYGTEQRFDGGNDPANREDLWRSGFDTQNGTFRYIKTLIELRKQLQPLRRGDLRIVWSSESEADGATDDAGIFAFERTYEGETVLVVLNTSNNKTSRPYSNGFSMQTSFPSGTRVVNMFCAEGPENDYGAHICSSQEQSSQAYTIGMDGSLGETLEVPPRTGLVLVAQ